MAVPISPCSRLRLRPGVVLLIAAVVAVTGCARIPELAATASADLRDSEYPALIALDQALEPLPPAADQAATLQASLDGRASRLQARARALQAPVVDAPTRARMKDGVGR